MEVVIEVLSNSRAAKVWFSCTYQIIPVLQSFCPRSTFIWDYRWPLVDITEEEGKYKGLIRRRAQARQDASELALERIVGKEVSWAVPRANEAANWPQSIHVARIIQSVFTEGRPRLPGGHFGRHSNFTVCITLHFPSESHLKKSFLKEWHEKIIGLGLEAFRLILVEGDSFKLDNKSSFHGYRM